MIKYDGELAHIDIEKDVHLNFCYWLGKQPKDIKNIVIVGGYTGLEIPEYLSQYPNSTIYVIEPSPMVFASLHQKFGLNKRVILFCCACSNDEGIEEFFETDAHGCGSLLKVKRDKENPYTFKNTYSFKVLTKRLENLLLKNEQIDLLQIDTQGTEIKVLSGIDLERINSIYLEVQDNKNWNNSVNKTVYQGQCFLTDIEEFLKNKFSMYGIGLDPKTDQGNSFWIKNSILKETKGNTQDNNEKYMNDWLSEE